MDELMNNPVFLGGFFIVITGLVIYVFINFKRVKSGSIIPNSFNSFEFDPIIRTLQRNQSPTSEEIYPLAADPQTRQNLFHILKSYHKTNLFPDEFYNFKDAAETNLVNWLLYYSNIRKAPSQIEFIRTVVVHDDVKYTYYVFKFRLSDLEGGQTSWLVGASGPYLPESKPFDWPKATFSRLTPLDEKELQTEISYIHRHEFDYKPGN